MYFDLKQIVESRGRENYELHRKYLNPMFVELLHIGGFDQIYVRACGAHLYDAEGNAYLDFVGGHGALNVGRNHPEIKRAMLDLLGLDLANMVQLDCSLLSGLLAESLVQQLPPYFGGVFFCNSGTEAVESAMKFARGATGRSKIVYVKGSFHGFTYGSLSLTDADTLHERFGPFVGETAGVAADDFDELERLLSRQDVAGFIFEPLQGRGVTSPAETFLPTVEKLCRENGTLLISDEVMTGFGRTGKWWGFEHWKLKPDIVTVAKSLSGGYVPCGAVITRREILDKVYDGLERARIHSNTFGRNNAAMACGLASLSVLVNESLVENSERMGILLRRRLGELCGPHTWFNGVNGRGLMLGLEFEKPSNGMHDAPIGAADFALSLSILLFRRYRILTEPCGASGNIVRLLPPLIITEKEVNYFAQCCDAAVKEIERSPRTIMDEVRNSASSLVKPKN